MISEDPVTASIIGGVAGIASAATGIASAFKKPEEPKQPQVQNQAAIQEQRRRMAAAQGRRSTILTRQPLGQVGNI